MEYGFQGISFLNSLKIGLINRKKQGKIILYREYFKKGELHMKSKRKRRLQHRISVMSISGVVLLLVVVLGVASISLQEKNRNYKAQEAELELQIQAELAREEEIAELESYVGSDEYVEDVAKDKLGLINPNEIIFKAEP